MQAEEQAGGVGAEPAHAAAELGAEIARLRREQGLTGQTLARAVGLSQSTVSKIENGLARPSPQDVERITQHLHIAPGETRRLVDLAERLAATSVRRGPRSPTSRRRGAPSRDETLRLGVGLDQQEVLDAERSATHIREFEPILLPGLIQISEYARRVVHGYHRVTLGGDASDWNRRTAEKVSQRILRQNLLYDAGRRFEFILMESVLGNRFAPAEYMIAQIKRIAAVAELENVTVRIVPSSAQLEYPHVQGFTILGESLVVVETLEATGYSHPDQLRIYQKIFDEYAAIGEPDPRPILARYRRRYADELTRAPGTAAPG
ncbi:helix-turn-helix transcriptional regulator [Frankia sp. R82]|uniref:helix-turn-helix domain-containing protein n=1 Tax=Frankia sp. R82 TaxID=2950553 RepID=UPI0020430177|nr:helix-turn-helix transcriptional regulator [Frankia sp. R82]MCM3882433.1 helix-turn-helix transcriptional regulator [Frankia sp. R82]